MSEIRFYHLQRSRLEDALPTILERAYARRERVLVLAGTPERAEALNSHLWTYRPDSFLPHGTLRDGEPGRQPILIATAGQDEALSAAGGAGVLILCDGAQFAETGRIPLVCEMFDGNDETALAESRFRWRTYKAEGHALKYFQQTSAGKWEEKT